MLKASELSIGVSGTRPLRKHLAKIYTRSRKLTCPHVFVKLCLAREVCRQPGWTASTIFEQYLSSTAGFISTGAQMSGSAALKFWSFWSRWRIISCLKAKFFCRKSLSRDWWSELCAAQPRWSREPDFPAGGSRLSLTLQYSCCILWSFHSPTILMLGLADALSNNINILLSE